MSAKKPKQQPVKFIDLFAGIGGFHIAMDSAGAECVFVSELDEAARKSYETYFKNKSPRLFLGATKEETANRELGAVTTRFAGDITKVDPASIDNFDVLCGGFPCQPFSQAGLKKGIDEPRGTLFEEIVKILDEKKPAAFFLENVRGLASHVSGDRKTLDIIKEKLMAAGYTDPLVIPVKASDYGVPQHRPRLFIFGFRDEAVLERFQAEVEKLQKQLPMPIPEGKTLGAILGDESYPRKVGYTLRVGGRGSGIHDRRNWDCYEVNGEVIRINKEHGLKMQGFPADFAFPPKEIVSETQAMKQLGNSVAVPAVTAYAEAIVKALRGGSNEERAKGKK